MSKDKQAKVSSFLYFLSSALFNSMIGQLSSRIHAEEPLKFLNTKFIRIDAVAMKDAQPEGRSILLKIKAIDWKDRY